MIQLHKSEDQSHTDLNTGLLVSYLITLNNSLSETSQEQKRQILELAKTLQDVLVLKGIVASSHIATLCNSLIHSLNSTPSVAKPLPKTLVKIT